MGNVKTLGYQLIDAQGRMILSETLHQLTDGSEHVINTVNAASGVYTLRFSIGEQILHKRIMIRR